MERSVLEDPTLDPFTKRVLSTLDPNVFTSLNPKQYNAFRRTLDEARPIRKHAVDIRGVIPLAVARYYFVVLAGRDHRNHTHDDEQVVRHRISSVLGALFLGSILLVPILSTILLTGYGIKSFLGIDIDPARHLIDYWHLIDYFR